MERCSWCLKEPVYIAYHDTEWGVPVKNREKLFEMLVLESMQAGLSWLTVLRKREAMRKAFFNFSPEKLAVLSEKDFATLLDNELIIRNRLKIKSLKTNANSFLQVEARENIVNYFWQFTDGKTRQNKRQSLTEIPTTTPASLAMAKQLKKDGFSFMGPTTCYAFMQAVGMINDHLQTCYRYKELLDNQNN